MSSNPCWTDGISLGKVPLKPHEWLFKLRKWDSKAFKPQSLSDWDFQASKLKEILTPENQGNALPPRFCPKNRVLIRYCSKILQQEWYSQTSQNKIIASESSLVGKAGYPRCFDVQANSRSRF